MKSLAVNDISQMTSMEETSMEELSMEESAMEESSMLGTLLQLGGVWGMISLQVKAGPKVIIKLSKKSPQKLQGSLQRLQDHIPDLLSRLKQVQNQVKSRSWKASRPHKTFC